MPLEQDEDQRHRADRFDFWLFLSVWLVIVGVGAIARLLAPDLPRQGLMQRVGSLAGLSAPLHDPALARTYENETSLPGANVAAWN